MARFRLLLASILLLLLGLARGAGGLVLLRQGSPAVDSNRISQQTVSLLGFGLLLIALGAIVASVGIMRRRVWGWRLGMIVPVIFVLDGALNGFLLFGKPGDRGTIINVVAALLIIGCLWAVRSTHRSRYRGGRP
jgi:hypothetical protein